MKRSPFCIIFTLSVLCLLLATDTANAQQAVEDNKFEAGGQLTCIRLGPLEAIATVPDGTIVRFDEFNAGYCGIGGRIGYNFNRYLAIEAEGNFFPKRNFNEGEQSRKAQLLAGLKAGTRTETFGVFVKARPGLMYFSILPAHRICNTSPINGDFICIGEKQTNFAFDVGGVVEYYPSSRTIIRLDLGDTIVRFKEAGPTQIFTSSIFTPANTTHSFQLSIGFSLRF
jgi:Outer membrane protein beta-barrel domain